LAGTAGTAAAKGKPPAPHPVHRPAPHPVHMVPRHLAFPKVTHHPRPIVYRIPAQHARHTATRIAHQPVRHTAIRTVHRYPVRRVPYRFVRRPRSFGLYGYNNYYYPRRYLWRTNYNRGYGALQRRRARVIGGIVEGVQASPTGGTLLVKVHRSRYGRFRYARRNAAFGSAASLRRFHLSNGTLYEVMTMPPRGGTVLDLHKGEHVQILTHAHLANTAQMVRVSRLLRR